MSSMTSTKIVLIALPFTIILTAFVVFVVFVIWNFHLFSVPVLKLAVDCASMKYETNLEEYISNRTVCQPKNASELTRRGCWSIRKRWFFPLELPDSMQVHHPLYLMRVVSKDYEYVEEVLSMMYSPLHFYCFPINANSTEEFQSQIRFLGMCLINVIVPEGLFNVTEPKGEFKAYAACLEHMEKFRWKHMVVMQENELPLHSIHFLADHSRRLGESSKIGRNSVSEEHNRILLSKNEEMEKRKFTRVSVKHELEFIKKAICSYLSGRREPLIISHEFSHLFFDIIQSEMSKQQLSNCQSFYAKSTYPLCISKLYDKQGNCILGMESYHFALNSRNLFVRGDPQFDLGFVQCVHQFLFDRTYNTSFYKIRYGSL